MWYIDVRNVILPPCDTSKPPCDTSRPPCDTSMWYGITLRYHITEIYDIFLYLMADVIVSHPCITLTYHITNYHIEVSHSWTISLRYHIDYILDKKYHMEVSHSHVSHQGISWGNVISHWGISSVISHQSISWWYWISNWGITLTCISRSITLMYPIEYIQSNYLMVYQIISW